MKLKLRDVRMSEYLEIITVFPRHIVKKVVFEKFPGVISVWTL